MSRFNPFPKVSCRYGAPMGRASVQLYARWRPDQLCASHPQGEYDSGGAYWGLGGADGPVYAVWVRGRGHSGVAYVRARSSAAAKLKAIEAIAQDESISTMMDREANT